MRHPTRRKALGWDGAQDVAKFVQRIPDLMLEPCRSGVAVPDPKAAVHAIANRTEGLDRRLTSPLQKSCPQVGQTAADGSG